DLGRAFRSEKKRSLLLIQDAHKLFFALVVTNKVNVFAAVGNEGKPGEEVKAFAADDLVIGDGKFDFAELAPVLVHDVINPAVSDGQRQEIRGHPDPLSEQTRRA